MTLNKKISAVLFFSIIFLLLFGFSAVLSAPDSFAVSPPVLKASVKSGENARLSFFVSNDGGPALFSLKKVSESDFVDLNVEEFYLDSESEQQVEAVLGSLLLKEGVYAGKILISNREDESRIQLTAVLEIESTNALFDVSAQVFQPSSRGNDREVNAEIKVHNLRSLNERALLKYEILDSSGKSVFSQEENADVKNEIQFTKKFILPEGIEKGDYVLAVIVRQGDSVGTHSTIFSYPFVLENRSRTRALLTAAIVLSIILVLAFLVFNYFWSRRLIENADYWSSKVKIVKKRHAFGNVKDEMQKLSYQKSLLEKAFSGGYITRGSYSVGISRLNEAMKDLKKRL